MPARDMIGFYFTFIAVLLTGIGARDMATVAGLTLAQGQRPMLLVLGIAISCGTAAFAGWAGELIAPMLIPKARLIFAALALGMAGLESLFIVPGDRPLEPTRSLTATAAVLLLHQATDAARFMIFAIAVATNAPFPAGLGGAIAGSVVIAAAWQLPEQCLHKGMAMARRTIGVLLLGVAAYIALLAFQIIQPA